MLLLTISLFLIAMQCVNTHTCSSRGLAYCLESTLSNLHTTMSQLQKQIRLQKQMLTTLTIQFAKQVVEIKTLKQKLAAVPNICDTAAKKQCGSCLCRKDKSTRYHCDCSNIQPKHDCKELYEAGIKKSGTYNILLHKKIIQVYCDQESNGGGWTVFQRRLDGLTNFNRNWRNYQIGFGNLQKEFWLGNDNIHKLTTVSLNPKGIILRIEMRSHNNLKFWRQYRNFHVDNEVRNYTLHLSRYSYGNIRDSMSPHNGFQFSTYDVSNNYCPGKYHSGWWFRRCYGADLNGPYHKHGKFGIAWITGLQRNGSIKMVNPVFVEMKMKRVGVNTT